MPCLFLFNLPEDGVKWHPKAVNTVIETTERLTGHPLKIYLSADKFTLLGRGAKRTPGKHVRGFLWMNERDWHETASKVTKEVAVFMDAHNLLHDITLMQMPPGSFIVDGEWIGNPPPSS